MAVSIFYGVIIMIATSAPLTTTVQAEERPAPVAVVVAKQGVTSRSIPLTGSVNSPRVSRISPKEGGYIDALMVDEGDQVKQGEPVLHLDRKLAEIELLRVRAQLAEAQAQLKESIRQSREAEKLVEKKHIAATTFEAAQAGVEINRAVVERLQADLKRQQEILDRHVVYAPFDGVISAKFIEVGQWVDINTALFELTSINPLRVEVPIPQYYFEQIQIGTPVRIQFDALPEFSVLASVTVKIPKADESGRTFPVKIDFTNEDHLVAPGMSARVHFEIGKADGQQVILLPADTVIRKPDGSEVVWVINEQAGRASVAPVPVKTGQMSRSNLEIISGELKTGDRVVIKGNEILQPGQAVNITQQLDYAL